MTYHGKKNYEEEQLRLLTAQSTSKHEIIKALGLPTKGTYGYRTLNHFLDLYSIDTSHFVGRGGSAMKITIPLDDILNGQHPQYGSHKLKLRLIKEGIFPSRCTVCGLEEWLGKPIPLDLDHINGKSWDHRLENVRLLCRNCHAQTDNFCGKNKKSKKLDQG